MDPDGYRRVREAFEECLALPDRAGGDADAAADARAAHLRATLGDAPELLRAAEAMLAAHRADDGFLTPPGAATLGDVAAGSAPLAPGTTVGEFEIVRPIGAGGMGEVWEARQERPRRLVALKALRTGLATERARRRFAAEADVLARLRRGRGRGWRSS